MQDKPKISIITPSKNTGRFARETIESILAQTYKNWEHIVIDGVSTDETLDIIRQYPHIRWISEPDSCPNEAFLKGLAIAKGEYIMLCCMSDGYLDKNWFKRCVEILDSRSEISLVWGNDQNMLEDGTLHKIVYNSWFDNPPPSGKDFIYYWLKNGTFFHERDLCVRKSIIEFCCAGSGPETFYPDFMYNFTTHGYLPYFYPIVAAYGRHHSDATRYVEAINKKLMAERNQIYKQYYKKIDQYKRKLIKREIRHQYRDGYGRILPLEFDIKRCFEYDKENKLVKITKFLIPPIFLWFKNKLLTRYRIYQNLRKIRKDLVNNSKIT